MGPDAVALFVGARLLTRSSDTEYPFRQDSDFLYLTGFDHPDAVAIHVAHHEQVDLGKRIDQLLEPIAIQLSGQL